MPPAFWRGSGAFGIPGMDERFSLSKAGVPALIKPIALNGGASDEGDDSDRDAGKQLPAGGPDDEGDQAEASGVDEPDFPVGGGLPQEPPQATPGVWHDETVPGSGAGGNRAGAAP
jgi:hypothetical protein